MTSEERSFQDFLEVLLVLTEDNIKLMNDIEVTHKEVKLVRILKYDKEFDKIRDLINSFDFVQKKSDDAAPSLNSQLNLKGQSQHMTKGILMETFKATKEMDLFFNKLYAIKMVVKTVGQCSKDPEMALFMRRIFEMLHELYKTEEEEQKEQNDKAFIACGGSNTHRGPC